MFSNPFQNIRFTRPFCRRLSEADQLKRKQSKDAMSKLDLIHRLIYLDRDYIAGVYEAATGTPSKTQITKTEGKKAGAAIPVFSAEISAGETRTFSLSTIAMLNEVLPELSSFSPLTPNGIKVGTRSVIGWVDGEMSVFKVNLRRREPPNNCESVLASEKYFGIHHSDGLKVALLATPEYFSSGIASLTALYETVLGEHAFSVKALVRALPGKSSFEEIIAVPLIILEAQ